MRPGGASWYRGPVFTAGLIGLVVAGIGAAARAAEDTGAPWGVAVRRVDEALGRKQFSAALKAADEAYGMAAASRRWEALLETGGAYRRIGQTTGLTRSFNAKARRLYLAALFQARQENALDGVFRVAEAFAGLGDTEVATQCVRIAERLAGRDVAAQAEVRAFAARLIDPALTAQQPGR